MQLVTILFELADLFTLASFAFHGMTSDSHFRCCMQ